MKGIKIILFLGAFACLCFSCRPKNIEIDKTIEDVFASTDLIDITGEYVGEYKDDSDPSTPVSVYMKVNSTRFNSYNFYVFRDRLYTDTLWIKSFSTVDNPIVECNYISVNPLAIRTNLVLTLVDCDSIVLKNVERSGGMMGGTEEENFSGKKVN